MLFQKKLKINFWVPLLAYLVINSLFVLKYGIRQQFVSEYILLLLYYFFIFLIVGFIIKKQFLLDGLKKFNILFSLFIITCFIFLVGIDFFVDGYTLNTDRWSALEIFIQSILNGEYPYNKLDHLGQTTSNLPGLFYIGLPFYFLGSIGLIQPFVFLFISIYLFKSNYTNHQKLLILVLLILSPAFLWEVYGKSDLMSNVFLTLLFVFIWNDNFKKNYFKNKMVLAFCIALLSLTRGVVFILLTVFLFKSFIQLKTNRKLVFLGWLSFFVVLLSLPILITIPNMETVWKHNPFHHQNAFMPKIMQILMLTLPFFLSFKAKKVGDVVKYTFFIFFIFLFSNLLLNVFEEGYKNAIIIGLSDISYVSMSLPFVIFYLGSYKTYEFKNIKT